jgi:hypothetical protein
LPACQARDSHDRAVLIGTARYYLEGRLVGRRITLAQFEHGHKISFLLLGEQTEGGVTSHDLASSAVVLQIAVSVCDAPCSTEPNRHNDVRRRADMFGSRARALFSNMPARATLPTMQAQLRASARMPRWRAAVGSRPTGCRELRSVTMGSDVATPLATA